MNRLQQLMATRNEWKLYRRHCDFTNEEIISAYAPDSPFKIYKNEIWWSDKWNALDYGRDYDFNRPFFDQFKDLQHDVPREGTTIFNSENCDYNGHIRESRNCYLNSLIARCEDTYYSYWMVNTKDVFDSLYTNDSTLCYYCNEVNNSYECVMLEESINCKECYFSFQLRGCDHCLFSSNLTNKSYYLFNKPCTPAEFNKIKNTLLDGSSNRWTEALDQYNQMKTQAIHLHVHNINCENVSGDHMYNSRNCENCFDGHNSEDCSNSISLSDSKDCHYCYSAGWKGCEQVTMSAVTRGSIDIKFCTYTFYSNKLKYCDGCSNCNDCFGCIGLQHQQYCILNKKYSKAEYAELIPKIEAHMQKTGEYNNFFPKNLSPFAYNETAAQDFFPLSEEEATKNGYQWRHRDSSQYQPATYVLPDKLADTPETITKEILACTETKKNYKITPQELAFYKTQNLPIPRQCPEQRHKNRMALRNPHQLYPRHCHFCNRPIQSTYSPKRTEKIYCKLCYQKSIN